MASAQAKGMKPATDERTPLDFERIYREHHVYVKSCLRTLGLSAAEAEDAAHDVFLIVSRRLEDYEPGRGSMRAWLFGIALRVVQNLRRCADRRNSSSELDPDEIVDDRISTPSAYVARLDVARLLDRLCRRLPAHEWPVYVLSELEGRDGPEIAALLEVPVNTVYSRLFQARRRVKVALLRERSLVLGGLAGLWLFVRDVFAAIVARSGPKAAGLAAFSVMGAATLWATCPRDRGPDLERPVGADATSSAASVGDVFARRPRLRPETSDDPSAAPERSSLRGVVRDSGGTGLGQATVCVRVDAPDVTFVQEWQATCVNTEPSGQYRIDGLSATRYRVSAGAPTFVPAEYVGPDGVAFVDLEAGATRAGIDLVLVPGGVEVRGVTRDVSGGVVGGATVTPVTPRRLPSSPIGVPVQSGDDGQFVLWAPPGLLRLEAHAPGYVVATADGTVPGRSFDLELKPGSALFGQVVDAETGTPVPGIRVGFGSDWSEWEQRYRPGIFTDADGRFHLSGISSGVYTPEVRDGGRYGRASQSTRVGFAETAGPVTIEVVSAAAVEGVIALPEGDAHGVCRDGYVALKNRASGEAWEAPTWAAGRVRFDAVLPGTYGVTVSCRGYVSQPKYPDLVVEAKDVLGQRWPVTAGLRISGVVESATGQPIAAAGVWAAARDADVDAPGRVSGGESDHQGRFALTGLREGEYEVTAGATGHARQAEPVLVRLEAGRAPAEVRIVLSTGGAIAGRVVDGLGRAVPHVGIDVKGPESHRVDTTGDDGRFEILGLETGAFRVFAQDAWDAPLRRPGANDDEVPGELAEVREAQTTIVTLVVEARDGVIEGTVVDEAGPVPDVYVKAGRESENEGQAGTPRFIGGPTDQLTDSEGRFTLRKLRPGRYTVVASRPGGGGEGRVEHVALGAEITVALHATASIAGVLTDVQGQSVDRFEITLQRRKGFGSGGTAPQVSFGKDGAFRLEGVVPGRYDLVAQALGGAVRQPLEVAEGEAVQGLALRLEPFARVSGQILALETGKPVPGMRAHVGAAFGPTVWLGGRGPSPEENRDSTDAEGRFEVHGIVPGRIAISVFPTTPSQAYQPVMVYGYATPGEVTTLQPIYVPRSSGRATAGDPGFRLRAHEDADPESIALEVVFVRPGGPAARAGLRVGDVIVAVAGHDVTGYNEYLYRALFRRPPGTPIVLRLQDGRTVTLRLGKP